MNTHFVLAGVAATRQPGTFLEPGENWLNLSWQYNSEDCYLLRVGVSGSAISVSPSPSSLTLLKKQQPVSRDGAGGKRNTDVLTLFILLSSSSLEEISSLQVQKFTTNTSQGNSITYTSSASSSMNSLDLTTLDLVGGLPRPRGAAVDLGLAADFFGGIFRRRGSDWTVKR
jgi:hypothetical protein